MSRGTTSSVVSSTSSLRNASRTSATTPGVVEELRRIYGDPEAVDLMVGLYAEKPPQGFAFSDTAFRVFILMASRRLKSDRFYTYDYRPEVYTPEGLHWIEQQYDVVGACSATTRA